MHLCNDCRVHFHNYKTISFCLSDVTETIEIVMFFLQFFCTKNENLYSALTQPTSKLVYAREFANSNLPFRDCSESCIFLFEQTSIILSRITKLLFAPGSSLFARPRPIIYRQTHITRLVGSSLRFH